MDDILTGTKKYYENTLSHFGDSPKGVDWKDEFSQKMRLLILLKNISLKNSSVIDLGCGTGALLSYANDTGQIPSMYYGVDLVEEMITLCRSKFPSTPNCQFLLGGIEQVIDPVDYVVASGIFNVKQNQTDAAWFEYVKMIITAMYAKCKKAIAFNVLTDQVDFRADKLFYCPTSELLSHCYSHSRHLVVDQSYPLYEYTVTLFKSLESK